MWALTGLPERAASFDNRTLIGGGRHAPRRRRPTQVLDMIPPKNNAGRSAMLVAFAIVTLSASLAWAVHNEGPDGDQWVVFAAGFGRAAVLALVLCWRLSAAFPLVVTLLLVVTGLAAWLVLDGELKFDKTHTAKWQPLSYATLAAPVVVAAAGVVG